MWKAEVHTIVNMIRLTGLVSGRIIRVFFSGLRARPLFPLFQDVDGQGGVSNPVSPTAPRTTSAIFFGNPIHIRNMNTTSFCQFGVDASEFNFRYQGMKHRPDGAEEAEIAPGVLA
jgi:hypothetical protein